MINYIKRFRVCNYENGRRICTRSVTHFVKNSLITIFKSKGDKFKLNKYKKYFNKTDASLPQKWSWQQVQTLVDESS